VTSRLAVLRKGRSHPQLRVAIERSRSREWLHRRATVGEVMRGSGDPRLCSWVVIDCRSRQAARGPSRPGAKSSWITGTGLAPLRESAGGAKERRKPDRRWQNREIGGGLPQNGRIARAIVLGALVEGRRSGSGKLSLLTRGRRKRSWFLTNARPTPGVSRGATGSVRGSIASSVRGRQSQARVGSPHRRSPASTEPKGEAKP